MNCTPKNLSMPVFTVLQTLSFVRWAAILILKFGHMPWQNRKKTSVFLSRLLDRLSVFELVILFTLDVSATQAGQQHERLELHLQVASINLSSLKTEQVVTQIIICSIVVRRRFRTFERSFVYCNKLDLRHNLSGI